MTPHLFSAGRPHETSLAWKCGNSQELRAVLNGVASIKLLVHEFRPRQPQTESFRHFDTY